MSQQLFSIGLPLLAGFLFGLAYFHAVRTTARYLAENKGWQIPTFLIVARLGGAIALLVYLARLGAMPLLAGFLGFLLARAVATRPARKER
jgi:F1F0 ATPase subunit 2